ncbi:MAG: tetratricopeptide repeat protein [Polyangiales bacterium]
MDTETKARSRKPTWRDVREQRQRQQLIGRALPLRVFRDNFVEPDVVPSYMVFSIVGEAGVGKSTLLDEYARIAGSPDIAAALITCDERHRTPVDVMGHIASELAKRGYRDVDFDVGYQRYRALHEEAQVPRGAIALLADGVRGRAVEVSRARADDKHDHTGDVLGERSDFRNPDWADPDDLALWRQPARVLSPLFVALLGRVSAQQRLVLAFDALERTAPELSSWLFALCDSQHGELDIHVTFVLAGREPLEPSWTQLASSICHVTLTPFDRELTRLYLANHGITDDALVSVIHDATRGLPLLVALLAAAEPSPDSRTGGSPPVITSDGSPTVIDRFLAWLRQPERGRVALLAAVPRRFTPRAVTAALGGDPGESAAWLATQSFLRTAEGEDQGASYHETLRELLLQHLRLTTPAQLLEAHTRLIGDFEQAQLALQLPRSAAYAQPAFRVYERERIFHVLCAQPERDRHHAFGAFLDALCFRPALARELAETCAEVAHALGASELSLLAMDLHLIHGGFDSVDPQEALTKLRALRELPGLTAAHRGVAHGLAARMCAQAGQLDESFAELDRALALDERNAWTWAQRGHNRYQLGRYDDALSDLGRALALEPDLAQALADRGDVLRVLGRSAEALVDLTRALELSRTEDSGLLGKRGLTYRQLGRYDDALADFTLALTRDPNNARLLASRAETQRVRKRYEAALLDFDRALALDDAYVWAFASRGLTHHELGRYEAALLDFDRALTLDPDYTWARIKRARTYRALGRYDDAIGDLDHVLARDGQNALALAGRGETHHLMAKYELALREFDRALELAPLHAGNFASRGRTYRALNRLKEALIDFDRAVSLDDTYAWAILHRGHTYRSSEKYLEASTDFSRAIELDPGSTWALASRGQVYLALQRYDDALTDLTQALTIDPDYAWALAQRAEVYRLTQRYDEALVDFGRALAQSESDWTLIGRGQVYRAQGRYEEALVDFGRALSLNDGAPTAWAERGRTLRGLGRYEEALADFERALLLKPDSRVLLVERGHTLRLLGRHLEALRDFDRVIALDERNVQALAHRGDVYRLLGRYAEALADLARAIALDETVVWAFVSRGQTQRALKQYDAAVADFTRALELDGTYIWALEQRAEAHASAQHYDDALRDLSRAIELDSHDDELRLQRGELHWLVGKNDDALADLTRTIELNPQNKEAFVGRALVYEGIGNHLLALEEYARALALDPDYTNARIGQLACYCALESADDFLRQAAAIRPLIAQASPYERAGFAALCGEREDAIACLELAVAAEHEVLAMAKRDPHLDPIRDDPRVQALLQAHEASARQRTSTPALPFVAFGSPDPSADLASE